MKGAEAASVVADDLCASASLISSIVDLDAETALAASALGSEPSASPPESRLWAGPPTEPSAPLEAGEKTPTMEALARASAGSCGGCGGEIRDHWLLRLDDTPWHEACLSCSMCGRALGQEASCFVRDGQVYCQADYRNVYSSKCGRCYGPVSSTEMVHRCFSAVYHLGCFSCFYCGQLLSKGDAFSVVEGQLVCSHDYEMMLASNFGESSRKAPKRPRTILTSSQRRAFKASFELSAKPCRKVRETLAKETGLSVRVVQVWFQNQRAKMKKIQRKAELQKLQEARKNALSENKSSSSDASSDKPILSPTPTRSSESDGSSDEETETATPIDKLYSMQDSYFY